jgi:hypothetical protein
MSINGFAQNFPQGVALIDLTNGQLTSNGYYLLLALWNRTGGGNGLPSVSSPLTASGTTQADALALGSDWNDVETVGANSGVLIPQMQPGADIVVWNGSANPLNVYPFSGAKIDGLGVNVAFSLAASKMRLFQCWSITQLRTAYQSP